MVETAEVSVSRSEYGGSSSQAIVVVRKDNLSETDEPSLESRVADNVKVVH